MEGRRVYGGSKMAAMLQNEGISAEAIEAVLASGSSSRGLGGSRSMVSFADVHGSTLKGSFYSTHELEEIGDEDFDECIQKPGKKKRLTTNQILFLEKTFELENKLEPEKKVQLAKDLALQPRQVAIWFQNRRARWKTKQLEKDFEALKSSYNVLKDNYENLFKEKEKLKEEVMLLTDKLLHKEKGNLETLHHKLSYPEPNLVSEIKIYNPSTAVNEHEDVSSSNSGVSNSNSPLCVNGIVETFIYEVGDSNAFEANHSDLSHEERDEEVKCCDFPKLEDVSYNHGFAIEDQGLWSWPYA